MWRQSRDSPGASDVAVLERARREDRLLVTFDRDFGELIFVGGGSGFPGVVFLRFTPQPPVEPAELLAELAVSPESTFAGFFTVVDRDHIRQRPLPVPPPDT